MKYIKLLRVKHYVKNGLVFLPLVFSLRLTEWSSLFYVALGFIAFCLVSSVVYIFNDLKDIQSDRNHSTKCRRPLASGAIKIPVAIIIAIILLAMATAIIIYVDSIWGGVAIILYLIINIAYSFGLKNIPVIEFACIAAGFVLRVVLGGLIVSINISPWLLYTVIVAAIAMAIGKRRNEMLKKEAGTRNVNDKYTKEFLDKTMYVFFTLIIAFFALWCINIDANNAYANSGIIWCTPLVIMIVLRYLYLLEQNSATDKPKSDGDPTNVLLTDIWLIMFTLLFIAFVVVIIYIPLPFRIWWN